MQSKTVKLLCAILKRQSIASQEEFEALANAIELVKQEEASFASMEAWANARERAHHPEWVESPAHAA